MNAQVENQKKAGSVIRPFHYIATAESYAADFFGAKRP